MEKDKIGENPQESDTRIKISKVLNAVEEAEESEEEDVVMEFLSTFGFETLEEAMKDYEAFNSFICMLYDPEFLEALSQEELSEMILTAASTPDIDLADTFLSNLEDIRSVIDNPKMLKKAEKIAKKTVKNLR